MRQVQAHCVLDDGPQPEPPRMKCPACGQALGLHHYLDNEMYVVDDEEQP